MTRAPESPSKPRLDRAGIHLLAALIRAADATEVASFENGVQRTEAYADERLVHVSTLTFACVEGRLVRWECRSMVVGFCAVRTIQSETLAAPGAWK